MTYAGWSSRSSTEDDDGGTFSRSDGREARPKLLIVIEQRALLRGFLTAWIGSLNQGFEVIGIADAEMALPLEALTRASLIVLGASVEALSNSWLDRQVTWLRANRSDVSLAAIVDLGDQGAAIGNVCHDRLLLQGYIPMSSSMEVAAAALQLVAAGGVYIPPSVGKHGMPRETVSVGPMQQSSASSLTARLTPRERAVLELLEQGMANKVIAYRLGMSQSTVKAHVHSIISKLNVRNRTEAAMSSYRPAMASSRVAVPQTQV